MRRAGLPLLFVLLGLVCAAPAMAGNWGESWGSMVWGSVAGVPTMGWQGSLETPLPEPVQSREQHCGRIAPRR